MKSSLSKRKLSHAQKLFLITLLGLLVCLLAGGTIGAAAAYRSSYATARAGAEHLLTGLNLLEALPQHPFNTQAITQARREFSAAWADLNSVRSLVNVVPGGAGSLPVYGTRISAAQHLLPLAFEASEMGITACDILDTLATRFHDPLNVQGLSIGDYSALKMKIQQLITTLRTVIVQANHLQPADLQLDPRLTKLVASFRKGLPKIEATAGAVEQLLPVLPALLGIGTPANYLIELLDSTELRPGGGFIGNYGIITLSGGRLLTAHIQDVYLFDLPAQKAGNIIRLPASYGWFAGIGGTSWGLRDSNIEADFPTSARYGEAHYKAEGGKPPLQGVIAVTPALIQQMLTITGPVYIPEYHETVTASNLVDRIHYHQEGAGREGGEVPAPDGHSSLRKHFTELLAEHFLTSVRQSFTSNASKFLQLFINAIRSKDVQLYLDTSEAEQVLLHAHLAADIQPLSGDGLFVVDANIAPNKANSLISNDMTERVTIDAQGNIMHRLLLTYTWSSRGEVYGSSLYRDYLRVYVPANSVLTSQQGWSPRGTQEAFGRKVWAGYFTLHYGQQVTIVLTWTVPASAIRDTQTQAFHYQYLIQRQAGTNWLLDLQVHLPSCAAVKQTQGDLNPPNPQHIAALSQPLDRDLNMSLDYTC